MKRISRFNEYQINEGWKENILTAISLAAGVAYGNTNGDALNKTKDKVEMTQSDERGFYSACFQLCQELKNSKLEFDQYKGVVEAQYYFQALRDGKEPKKLSEFGEAAAKSIMQTVMDMDVEEVNRLAKIGETGQLTYNW